MFYTVRMTCEAEFASNFRMVTIDLTLMDYIDSCFELYRKGVILEETELI